jgi:hypothetical protein
MLTPALAVMWASANLTAQYEVTVWYCGWFGVAEVAECADGRHKFGRLLTWLFSQDSTLHHNVVALAVD